MQTMLKSTDKGIWNHGTSIAAVEHGKNVYVVYLQKLILPLFSSFIQKY